MKNINLLPSNHQEKFYISTYLKKALTIIVFAFFILILIVILLEATFSYLKTEIDIINIDINNTKYIDSEKIFQEKMELSKANLTLTNIANATNKKSYTYLNVLNDINDCFKSSNITMESLVFNLNSSMILNCYSNEKKYIYPLIVKLNEVKEVKEINLLSIEKKDDSRVDNIVLEIILK